MVKVFMCLVLSFFAIQGGEAAAPEKSKLEGLWESEITDKQPKPFKVMIQPCKKDPQHLCGILKELDNTIKNDPKAKVGMEMLSDFKKEKDVPNSYVDGTIFDVHGGGVYSSKMELLDDKHLSVSGCMLKILCQSQTWTRVG